jgi:hypothetical protein
VPSNARSPTPALEVHRHGADVAVDANAAGHLSGCRIDAPHGSSTGDPDARRSRGDVGGAVALHLDEVESKVARNS